MGEYITKPVCRILMLKGEKGYKGDKGDSIPSGGTTGQFLKKKSNTDYEYEWADITPTSVISNTEIDDIIKG